VSRRFFCFFFPKKEDNIHLAVTTYRKTYKSKDNFIYMKNDLENMVNTIKRPKGKRLITAALPYINNVPHLGHIVGSHLPADIFARFCRSKGYETLFVGGTDENGSTSEIAAEKVGVNINEFSDRLHLEHKKVYDWFNISYDNFSRTSTPLHYKTAQDFFKQIDAKGHIIEGSMKVFYSPKDERFLPDRYVVGECPNCGYEEANGDQCEKCTSLIDSSELKNPHSSLSGGKIEIRDSSQLFFAMDKLSPQLKKWVDQQTQWRIPVRNLALGWIKEGLKPRSITRDLKHGVPVPKKGYEDKVLYVWFDAPIGYITSTKEASEKWRDFWSGDAEIFNFLGKDNIPFHTILWPEMIMSQGKFNLPSNVVGLQYLNYEGQKFSKSKQIGVFCEKLPELGLEPDIWRSYLTKVIPEVNDTEFRWRDFQEKTNSDLIGNYGNYVNRIVKFVDDRLEGKIEKPAENRLTERDREMLERIKISKEKVEGLMEAAEIRKAYEEILGLCSEGNKYIHDTEPWKEIKSNPQRAKDIFYNGARLLKAVTTFIAPYLPQTSEKVWKQLNLSGSPLDSGSWDTATEGFGREHTFGISEILFNKMKDEDVKKYKDASSKATNLKGFFNQ